VDSAGGRAARTAAGSRAGRGAQVDWHHQADVRLGFSGGGGRVPQGHRSQRLGLPASETASPKTVGRAPSPKPDQVRARSEFGSCL